MKTKFSAFIIALLAAGSLWACSVPVFRYALERWPPDLYQVVVAHKGSLSSNDLSLVDELTRMAQETGPALPNMIVRTLDLAGQADDPLLKSVATEIEKGLPRMLVLYPGRSAPTPEEPVADVPAAFDFGGPFLPNLPSVTPGGPLAFSGPLTAATVQALADSPARREIVSRLLKGDSIAWVLLESGNKPQDNEAFERLETELKKLEADLNASATNTGTLFNYPDGGQADPFFYPEAVPVKIAFSILRVAREDPAESVFISMLLNSEANLNQSAREPMAFPLFGQGRVLYALVGRGINSEHISEACLFLAGNCSCQVKSLNPGTDLLLTADWTAISGPSAFAALPPADLTGIFPEQPSTTAAPATGQAAIGAPEQPIPPSDHPEAGPVSPPLADQPVAEVPEPAAPKPLAVVFVSAIVVLVLAVLLASLWLRRGKRE